MKISLLSLFTLTLIGCLLLNPLNVMALHHEDENSSAADGKLPNNEGIVVSVIDTTGYTYMELDNAGRIFWIAAPTTQVKKGDHIRFVESMSMENFLSKSLDRTFRRIIFVSSTMTKK